MTPVVVPPVATARIKVSLDSRREKTSYLINVFVASFAGRLRCLGDEVAQGAIRIILSHLCLLRGLVTPPCCPVSSITLRDTFFAALFATACPVTLRSLLGRPFLHGLVALNSLARTYRGRRARLFTPCECPLGLCCWDQEGMYETVDGVG